VPAFLDQIKIRGILDEGRKIRAVTAVVKSLVVEADSVRCCGPGTAAFSLVARRERNDGAFHDQ
jgi:hypothetical protein